MPPDTAGLRRRIDQALGRSAADLVIKNTRFVDLVSGELLEGDIAVCGDRIVGTMSSARPACATCSTTRRCSTSIYGSRCPAACPRRTWRPPGRGCPPPTCRACNPTPPSSVGHDSHNVIVVGVDDGDMATAVNRLIELQGGYVAAVDGQVRAELPLPIAGLMTDAPASEVCASLRALAQALREMGCQLDQPLLQLAFLPLPVVPHLKITDRGLVDVDRFELL